MPYPPVRNTAAEIAIACGLGLLTLWGATGCRTARLLEADEYLVVRNRVTLSDGAEVAEWPDFRIELRNQVVTQPNGTFLFVVPREWYYLRQRARDDTSRYSGFVRRVLAEPPAFLDGTETSQSVDRLEAYMLNRGYFDASVTASLDTLPRKRIRVTYAIAPGAPYLVDTVRYLADDAPLLRRARPTDRGGALRPGARIDARYYDQEVARIVATLRDTGYAFFFANSISPLEADSTDDRHRLDASLRILPPDTAQQHRQYRIGRVLVYPDTDPLATSQTLGVDTTYDGLRFIYEDTVLRVSPRAIAENVFIRPGDLYRQSDLNKTNLQLNSLGVFRTVSIQQERSGDHEDEIDFFVQLTPSTRWAISVDPELSVTDRQSVSAGRLSLIGPKVSGNLSNRNLRGGAERLNLSVDAGLEFNFARLNESSVQRLNTVELGADAAYQLPRFIDYFGAYRLLHRFRTGEEDGEPIRFISDDFYTALRDRATTSFQAGARYVSLLNFYRTTTLSALFGYEVSPTPNDRYTINHTGLEFFTVDADTSFQRILDQTPFLQRSFNDQVFSGFLFRNLSYVHTSPPGRRRNPWTILADVEQSGFEAFAVNKAYNGALGRADEPFRLGASDSLGNRLDYARYVRLVGSLSQQRRAGPRQEFAWRVTSGAALTFGYDRDVTDVPYVRQFFAGGNASMRGWQARSLGPGAFVETDSLAAQSTFINYQQANFKLEANLEYRTFITDLWTTRLDGAVFLDVGNIWTIREDASRPGSQFRFTQKRVAVGDGGETIIVEPFWRQLAVNTGFGFRWDISYVLLRLDVGIKLRSPYPVQDGENASYWPRNFDPTGQNDNLQRTAIAIGLGYPF